MALSRRALADIRSSQDLSSQRDGVQPHAQKAPLTYWRPRLGGSHRRSLLGPSAPQKARYIVVDGSESQPLQLVMPFGSYAAHLNLEML